MEALETPIMLADGKVVHGLLNAAVMYRLENTGKFDDILKRFWDIFQNGLGKGKEYMDRTIVLYVAYLGKNYNPEGNYMKYETFLEAIPFSKPFFVEASYNMLFFKKKQASETNSGNV